MQEKVRPVISPLLFVNFKGRLHAFWARTRRCWNPKAQSDVEGANRGSSRGLAWLRPVRSLSHGQGSELGPKPPRVSCKGCVSVEISVVTWKLVRGKGVDQKVLSKMETKMADAWDFGGTLCEAALRNARGRSLQEEWEQQVRIRGGGTTPEVHVGCKCVLTREEKMRQMGKGSHLTFPYVYVTKVCFRRRYLVKPFVDWTS